MHVSRETSHVSVQCKERQADSWNNLKYIVYSVPYNYLSVPTYLGIQRLVIRYLVLRQLMISTAVEYLAWVSVPTSLMSSGLFYTSIGISSDRLIQQCFTHPSRHERLIITTYCTYLPTLCNASPTCTTVPTYSSQAFFSGVTVAALDGAV